MKKTRDEILRALRYFDIGAHYHYIPVYTLLNYYNEKEYVEKYFPNMQYYYKNAITIPLFPALLDEPERLEFLLMTVSNMIREGVK